MKTYKVKFDDFDHIVYFANVITQKDGKFEFVSDRYVINAKSLLGLLNLDFAKSLDLRVENGVFPMELSSILV